MRGEIVARAIIETVCQQCGAIFLSEPCHNRKFCGTKCQHAARRKQTQYTCETCKKIFVGKTCDNRKYCSIKCMGIAMILTPSERLCPICGNTFIPKKEKQTYCSLDCAKKVNASFETLCLNCGMPFFITPSRAKRGGKYCSMVCLHAAQSGSSSSHWRGGKTRNYRGPNWKQQRKLARQRDSSTCQYCHRKWREGEKLFHVHHIKPYREFNDYIKANNLSNLITLCKICHGKAETGKIILQPKLL